MPVLDDYSAKRKLGAPYRLQELPIIALITKTLAGERAGCLMVGIFESGTSKADHTMNRLNPCAITPESYCNANPVIPDLCAHWCQAAQARPIGLIQPESWR